MPTVKKDNRQWFVVLTFENTDCPHRYYPDSYIGCMELLSPNNECTPENCPYISRMKKEAK